MNRWVWLIGMALFILWLHWNIWMEYREQFWSRTVRTVRTAVRRARSPWAEEDALIEELHRHLEALQQKPARDAPSRKQDSRE